MTSRTVTLDEARTVAHSWKMGESDEDIEKLRRTLQEQYDTEFRRARQKNMAELRKNRIGRRRYWAALASMPDAELVDELIDIAAGDDYDGGFTVDGQANLWFAKRQLKSRLSKANKQDTTATS